MYRLISLAALLISPTALAGDVEAQVDGIVALYRDAIVLGAAAPELSEGQRRDVPVLGKLLLAERRDALATLEEALADDVPRDRKDRGRDVDAFLDTLEEDADLRDGDKLAFRELLDRLERDLAAAPEGRHRDDLLARVRADRQALAEVEERYREEMRAVLGTLRTRGMQLTREQWDAYLDAIRAERPVEDIFARYAEDLSAIVGGTRGWKDNPLELYGTSLPDKTFVLTFDDGPHPEHTAAILDILAERDAKGVFFQVGRNVGDVAEGELDETEAAAHTRRLLDEGHWLGSHSWSHANLPRTSDAQLTEQLDRADRVLDTVSGDDVVLFRPPYGGRDGRVLQALQERGTRAYLWNVDSMDWSDPIPESIAQTVWEQVNERGHGVILLHDVHPQTVEALPLLLDLLEEGGYRLVLWDGEQIVDPTRGAPEPPKAPERSSLYADSWAVVVGVNDYAHWPRLAYAVHDAQGVRDKLVERFGFREDRVIGLFDGDATRQRILEVLGDELPKKVGEDDRVFVFYAGHGATRALPGGGERGYIVPVDADMEHLQSQAISMSVLQDVQESLPAKHVMFVMDACYSGIALTRAGGYTGDPRRYLSEITRRRARQILTAGGADEQVADHGPGGHSIFTWTVLQGMDGAADLNGDGFITASELSSFVAPRVSSLSAQTPAFGSLVGSEGGEFILTLEADEALLSSLSGHQDESVLSKARDLLAAKDAENQELLAELARMQERLAEMVGFGRGAEADPRAEAQKLHTHGLEMYRAGQLAESYEALRQAAELDGSNVEIVNNLGYVLQELGEHERALPWFERAVSLDAERAVAYLNLGDSLQALDRRDEAVAAYARYLEMVPETPVRERIEAYIGG